MQVGKIMFVTLGILAKFPIAVLTNSFLDFQVWQMAENIYNDEEPETPATELEAAAS